jgi:hypothetical protein
MAGGTNRRFTTGQNLCCLIPRGMTRGYIFAFVKKKAIIPDETGLMPNRRWNEIAREWLSSHSAKK